MSRRRRQKRREPGWVRIGELAATPWEFSPHAEERMAEMGLGREEIEAALNEPRVVYPGAARLGTDKAVAVGGRLAVVHDPARRVVVTVLWDGLTGRDVG